MSKIYVLNEPIPSRKIAAAVKKYNYDESQEQAFWQGWISACLSKGVVAIEEEEYLKGNIPEQPKQ